MYKKILLCLIIFLCNVTSLISSIETYLEVSKDKSFVGFDINQFGLGIVSGEFESYSINARFQNESITSLNASIEIKSIKTGNKTRDRHLQSKQFFYTKKYPEIKFQLTQPLNIKDSMMFGELTMRGTRTSVAIPVSLNYKILNDNLLIYAKTKNHNLSRKNYGLVTYKRLISDVVQTNISIVLETIE